MVGKTCEKGKFWAEGEKVKELRRVEMMMMYMNIELPWVKCGECEGDWLVDWRNETGSWFQRWGDAKRNEQFKILKEADDGQKRWHKKSSHLLTYGEQPSGVVIYWSDATVLDDYAMTTTTTT